MKEWLEDKIDDVNWFFRRSRESYYNFKYGIKNLIRWIPVIWKIRGWDFGYMFPLWEQQFEEMEKSFESANDFVVGNERRLKRIRICKELCRRLKDDWWYHENAFIYHERKWGEIKFDFSNDGRFNSTRENVKNPEDDKLETKQSLILYKNVENHKKEDMQMLLNYINKYWQNWWW